MHVRVADDLAELLEVDLAVLVLVGKVDGLVDNLLELGVLQVGAHHHFEDLKQLAVADVAVVVDVVNSGRELKTFSVCTLTLEHTAGVNG